MQRALMPKSEQRVLHESIWGAAAVTQSDTPDGGPSARMLGIVCTVAGDVKVGFEDDTTFTFPVTVGLTMVPFSVTHVFSAGTTATATFTRLK